MYNMENSIEVKFWIELETTVDNMNEFTKSEDCRLVAEILKKYSCDIVVVEYNATHSPLEDKIVLYNENTRWDGTDYFGASLLSYTKLKYIFDSSFLQNL